MYMFYLCENYFSLFLYLFSGKQFSMEYIQMQFFRHVVIYRYLCISFWQEYQELSTLSFRIFWSNISSELRDENILKYNSHVNLKDFFTYIQFFILGKMTLLRPEQEDRNWPFIQCLLILKLRSLGISKVFRNSTTRFHT